MHSNRIATFSRGVRDPAKELRPRRQSTLRSLEHRRGVAHRWARSVRTRRLGKTRRFGRPRLLRGQEPHAGTFIIATLDSVNHRAATAGFARVCALSPQGTLNMQSPSHSGPHDRLGTKLAFFGVLLALATASSGCSKSSAAAGGDSHKEKPQAAAEGVTPAAA